MMEEPDLLSEFFERTDAKLTRLSDRLDAFIAESRRIMTNHEEQLSELKAIANRLDLLLTSLKSKDCQ